MGGTSSVLQRKVVEESSLRVQSYPNANGKKYEKSFNSVRAMARKVHAKQENSFISQEAIRAEFEKRIDEKKETAKLSRQPILKSYGDEIIDERPEFRKRLSLDLKLDLNMEAPEDVEKPTGVPPADSYSTAIDTAGVDTEASITVDGTSIAFSDVGIIGGVRNLRSVKLPMKERLVMLYKLGSGSTSAVYKALDLHEMKLVAVKIIQVHDSANRNQMVRELTALHKLLRVSSRRESRHRPKRFRRPEKYIVDFYDAFCNLEDNIVAFMIEYMDGGSLQDIVDMGGCEDESTLASIAVQVLTGLSFLHENGQLHRDLKPANLLMSNAGEVKIADLGLMKQLKSDDGISGRFQRTNTFIGTTAYMSPERINGKPYDLSADIWSFGISLVAIATGDLPVDTSEGYWGILNSITSATVTKLPSSYTPMACDFVSKCLKKNPAERWDCKQLLQHPFLRRVAQESLCAEEDFELAREELVAIVDATYMHIKQLKSDAVDMYRNANELGNPRIENEIRKYTQHRLFGDLLNSSAEEILHKVLFESKRTKSGSSLTADVNAGMANDCLPPLWKLAKQLNISVEMAVEEAQIHFNRLTMKPSNIEKNFSEDC